MMNNKSKKLLSNAFIFMVGNLGTKVIQFFLVPLYTYTLSSDQYGETELVISLVSFLIPIFSLSISDGLLRFGVDGKNKKGEVLKNATFIVLIGSVLAGVVLPLTLKYNPVLYKWRIYILALLIFRIIRDVLAINLKIKDKNKYFAADGMIYTSVLCGLSYVSLAVLNMGVVGYLNSQLCATVISSLFLIAVGKPISAIAQSGFNMTLLKEMVYYSIPMVPNAVAWWIISIADRFIIQLHMTSSDVGIYGVAAKIPAIIMTVTGLFNQAWIISSAVEYDKDDHAAFYTNVFKAYCFVLFISIYILQAVLKPFLNWYVSPEYYDSLKSAYVLVCSASVSCIASFLVGVYSASKKNISIMATTIIGAIINVCLNCIFIEKMGVIGAAIATLISWFVITTIRLFGAPAISGIKVDYKSLYLYIVLALAQCVAFITFDNAGYIVSVLAMVILLFREKILLKRAYRYIRLKLRELFIVRSNRKKLKNKDFSIIASDCTGGIIYNDLKQRFLSPTINMFMPAKDFILFCTDIKFWTNQPLMQVASDKPYPVAQLGDGRVKVYFVHYKTFEEAKEKWNERKQRINYDNIFVIFNDRNGCTTEDMIAFDKLNFEHKVIFTCTRHDDINSSYFISGKKNSGTVPTMSDWKSVFSIRRNIDMFDYVSWLNGDI